MGKEPANLIELIKQLKDKGIPEEDFKRRPVRSEKTAFSGYLGRFNKAVS